MKVLYVVMIIFSDPEGAVVIPERFPSREACIMSFNAATESGLGNTEWGRNLIGIGSRAMCLPIYGEGIRQ